MFAAITNFFSILKALLDFWNYFKKWQEDQRIAEANKKSQAAKKAIEDLKNAKTQEEVWDAQNKVVKNKQ